MKENGFKLAKKRSRRYHAQTIMDVDYADDIALPATHTLEESLLQSLEWAAGGVGLHVNADKTEYMCFYKRGDISTLKGGPLKLVDTFIYRGSGVSSTENDINTRLAKAWKAINRLLVIWKSDLTDKINIVFFQAVVVSILLYGCIKWTLTKRKKAWRELYKNAASYIEQILEATPDKRAAVLSPITHHENYPN